MNKENFFLFFFLFFIFLYSSNALSFNNLSLIFLDKEGSILNCHVLIKFKDLLVATR